MRSATLSVVLLAATLAPVAHAQDYGQGPTTYYLHAPSSEQHGCWGPCACPLTIAEPMLGTFTLSLITVGDATDFYSLSNINWTVPTAAGQPLNLTGSGTLGAGQVPFASHQNMSLDLTLSPPLSGWGASQHFDTTPAAAMRTVPPPVIDIEVANSTTGCPGIRLRIVASRCRADWNASGTLEIADVLDFLSAWFAQDPRADLDNNGFSIQDVFAFVNAWFAGCP